MLYIRTKFGQGRGGPKKNLKLLRTFYKDGPSEANSKPEVRHDGDYLELHAAEKNCLLMSFKINDRRQQWQERKDCNLQLQPWLPDGYSQIFRIVCVWPFRHKGLWLCYATLQNLIPSFPWIAPPHPPPWRNPRKGRNKILQRSVAEP